MAKTHKNSTHPNSEIAYHFEWGFNKDALVWYGVSPTAINFYPIATEFRNWMLRKGQFSIISSQEKGAIEAITNPYSYYSSAIAAILAQSINASHEFSSSKDEISDMAADIERIRLYNEQVLYTARICEVTIKQLLHCTLIPSKLYKNTSLGGLLASDCKPCRKAGKPHKKSLLGSLAHRYHLCLPFELCLFEHLKIVNRRRNLEAAHSEAQIINIRTAEESREQLLKDSQECGEELVHMLQHISDLEQEMMKDLKKLSRKPYEQWS